MVPNPCRTVYNERNLKEPQPYRTDVEGEAPPFTRKESGTLRNRPLLNVYLLASV